MQKILFFIICMTDRSDNGMVAFFIKRIKNERIEKETQCFWVSIKDVRKIEGAKKKIL